MFIPSTDAYCLDLPGLFLLTKIHQILNPSYIHCPGFILVNLASIHIRVCGRIYDDFWIIERDLKSELSSVGYVQIFVGEIWKRKVTLGVQIAGNDFVMRVEILDQLLSQKPVGPGN